MDILKKVTKDAERLLKSLRARYYIELPDGAQIWHGLEGFELVEAQPEEKEARKPRTTRTGAPFGALVAYYKPYLDQCTKTGDVAEIPFGDFKDNPEHLRGAIAAHCTQCWGKGTYKSVMNRVKGQVEVLRLQDAAKDRFPDGRMSKSKSVGEQPPGAVTEAKATGGGTSKFRTVGHGLDALGGLHFEQYDDEQKS